MRNESLLLHSPFARSFPPCFPYGVSCAGLLLDMYFSTVFNLAQESMYKINHKCEWQSGSTRKEVAQLQFDSTSGIIINPGLEVWKKPNIFYLEVCRDASSEDCGAYGIFSLSCNPEHSVPNETARLAYRIYREKTGRKHELLELFFVLNHEKVQSTVCNTLISLSNFIKEGFALHLFVNSFGEMFCPTKRGVDEGADAVKRFILKHLKKVIGCPRCIHTREGTQSMDSKQICETANSVAHSRACDQYDHCVSLAQLDEAAKLVAPYTQGRKECIKQLLKDEGIHPLGKLSCTDSNKHYICRLKRGRDAVNRQGQLQKNVNHQWIYMGYTLRAPVQSEFNADDHLTLVNPKRVKLSVQYQPVQPENGSVNEPETVDLHEFFRRLTTVMAEYVGNDYPWRIASALADSLWPNKTTEAEIRNALLEMVSNTMGEIAD